MGLTVSVHNSLADAALAGQWDSLSRQGAGSLFTTRAWCRCWNDSIGADQEAHVLAAWNGNRLQGLLPLSVRATPMCQYLEIMGARGVTGDHMNWIEIESASGGGRSQLIRVLDALGTPADILALNNVDCGSSLHLQARLWAEKNALPFYETPPQPVPQMALPPTLDDYVAGRSKKMRYHIRKGKRQLRECDGSVQLVRSAAAVPELIDAFCQLHALRWKSTGRRGSFEKTVHQKFLRSFCLASARHGMLRAYGLYADGRIEGVLIAFHWRDVAYFYQIARRPDSRFESPGVILIGESIRRAISERVSRYDFLQGDESYKRRWTDHCVNQRSLFIGLTHTGSIRIAAMRAKRGLKRAVEACRSIRQPNRKQNQVKAWMPLPTEVAQS